MFIFFLLLLVALFALGAFYLITRFRRFAFFKRLAGSSKLLAWVFPALPVALLYLLLLFWGFTAFVILMHLILFWALSDLVFFLIRKARKKGLRFYWAGAVALLFTAVYLSCGSFFAYHVFETHYSLSTTKDLPSDSLRVVQISDSHLGVTLDRDSFAKQVSRIQACDPDLVVITGDFVDDDSVKADMLAACKALGNLETTYGVYFIWGNHDKGYFNGRDFSEKELREALDENDITLLEDEITQIADTFYLVGRKDRSDKSRADMSELAAWLDPDQYAIVLDHQPHDYDNEAAAGVDLVLSGHTHGGHIFPVGQIGLLLGANDRVYGLEKRENTTFIVSSGISGWAIPIKTGTISEFVVIDITEE